MGIWELLEYIGEALVFMGVIGEVFAEWCEPERKTLGKASSILLIIGLALSLSALIETNNYFNGTIADLNLKSSQANERAAANEVEAGRQRVRADADEKQLLQVEHSTLPRMFDVNRVASKLTRFRTTAFKIVSLSDFEPAHTAQMIGEALRQARWRENGLAASVGAPQILSVPGIWIISSTPVDWYRDANGNLKTRSSKQLGEILHKTERASQALALALRKEGLQARLRPFDKDIERQYGRSENGQVDIFVSLKPMDGSSSSDLRVVSAGPR